MAVKLPTHQGVTGVPGPADLPPTGIEAGFDSAPMWTVERAVLLRLAFRFCWNASDAEDAVQESLLRAAEQWRVGARPEKPEAWLKAIVVRRSIEANRRGGRRERLAAGAAVAAGVPAVSAGAAHEIELCETSTALRELIQELPERQRIALVLRHLDEMSFDEIAEVMEVTGSTVRGLVRNARDGLREMMLRRSPGLMPESGP